MMEAAFWTLVGIASFVSYIWVGIFFGTFVCAYLRRIRQQHSDDAQVVGGFSGVFWPLAIPIFIVYVTTSPVLRWVQPVKRTINRADRMVTFLERKVL